MKLKRLGVICVSALLAASLTACQGGGSSSGASSASSDSKTESSAAVSSEASSETSSEASSDVSSEASSEEPAEESSEESAVESLEESAVESSEESVEESSEESVEESSEESVEESFEEPAEESSEEPAEESSEEPAEESSEEPAEESSEEPAEESSEEPAEESSEEPAEESSEEPGEDEYVSYVLDGEITRNMIEKSRLNEGNKVRLANVIKKLQNGENVTVGYIGGSITQGTSAGNELCYAKLTTNWLEETFPNANITYVNAGIGATGSYIGTFRVTDDLLVKDPDLVFVEFSVNDTADRTEINKTAYDSLLRTIWNYKTNPAIITIVTTQEDGTSFQTQHSQIAKAYDLPMISYHDAILDVIAHGDIKWSDISNDNIHPNVPGHKIVSQLLQSYISDVVKQLPDISGPESDFSNPPTDHSFENGRLLNASNCDAQIVGFKVNSGAFGGFSNYWMAKKSSGSSFEDTSLTIEVEGQSVGILYGKMTKNAGKAGVYVDGELVTTLNGDFTGGWGNYAEFEHIVTFDAPGKHTLKIVPVDTDDSAMVVIAAIAVA